jgi:hypothetical protein
MIVNTSDFQAGAAAVEIQKSDREKLSESLNITLNFCKGIFDDQETSAKKQASTTRWILWSGIFAGTIAAPALIAANPAANATWVAALSGWGGASGLAARQSESLGMTGASMASQRNQIVDNFTKQLSIGFDSRESLDKRLSAFEAAKVECIAYKVFTSQSIEE